MTQNFIYVLKTIKVACILWIKCVSVQRQSKRKGNWKLTCNVFMFYYRVFKLKGQNCGARYITVVVSSLACCQYEECVSGVGGWIKVKVTGLMVHSLRLYKCVCSSSIWSTLWRAMFSAASLQIVEELLQQNIEELSMQLNYVLIYKWKSLHLQKANQGLIALLIKPCFKWEVKSVVESPKLCLYYHLLLI